MSNIVCNDMLCQFMKKGKTSTVQLVITEQLKKPPFPTTSKQFATEEETTNVQDVTLIRPKKLALTTTSKQFTKRRETINVQVVTLRSGIGFKEDGRFNLLRNTFYFFQCSSAQKFSFVILI